MNPRAVSLAIVAVSLLAAVGAFFVLPDVIVTHWGLAGEPNGWMPKWLGLGFFPVSACFLLFLFRALPSLDPLHAAYTAFRGKYEWFVAGVLAFMAYIEALTIAWNLGWHPQFGALLSPAFAALLYGVGVLFTGVKRNWFVGIRTPWTLSSERVWDKTHALGAKLFKAAGALMLLGVVFPQYAVEIILILAIVPSAALVAYSFFEFRRERAGK